MAGLICGAVIAVLVLVIVVWACMTAGSDDDDWAGRD